MTTEEARYRTGDVAAAEREDLVRLRLHGEVRRTASIGRADRGTPLPLSAGQRQMWVLHQLDPSSPAYLMSWALRLTGDLDVEAVRRAWEQLVHRHEILRTRYAQPGDEPVQLIDPPARFDLPLVDLCGEPEADREDHGRRVVERERQRPFELAAEHPLRVTLVRLDTDVHLLVVVVHHVACDAASYRRLGAEVGALYAAHVTGEPAGLPEVAVQYADYAVWEGRQVADAALRPHVDYWRRQLAGVPELSLPADRPRAARPDWRGGTVVVPLDARLGADVRNLAAARRASPFVVLLAAYQATLAQLCGSDDVAVGTPVAMHASPELDHLIGYTVNTVVVRTRFRPEDTFEDLLDRVRDTALEALDHRQVPFARLVEELRPTREAAGNPLFQVAFDLNPAEDGAFDFPGVDTRQLRFETWGVAKFDLTVHAEEDADGRLSAYLEFAHARFDDETARRVADHYGLVLETLVRAPDTRLAQLPGADLRRPRPAGAATTTATAPAAGPVGVDGGVETAGDLAAVVDRMWREVLRRDRVEPDDNFFDIGGDSVRAVALAGRLRTYGLDVSAVDIFAHQTVNELTRVVADRRRTEVPTGTLPFSMVTPADRESLPPGLADAYPVGVSQLGMIVEMQARPDLNPYQDTTSFLIRGVDGPFAPAAFRTAVQRVVDRHEVLRTTFELSRYSVPLQLVHPDVTYTAGVTHGAPLGEDGWEPRLREYFDYRRSNPMDLAEAPLVRVHAHTAEGTDDWALSITECHPVLEGWSFHSLLMEILDTYGELRAGRTPPMPEPVPFRYADYIAAEIASMDSQEDRAYWRGVIEGRAPCTLPSAWQDDHSTPRERYQHTVMYDDLEEALRGLATRTRTSLKAVLLGAHLTVMAAVTEAESFFTGLVSDARPEMVGADRVPGFYINTVPFAMPVGARNWGDLVRLVYDGLTAMWPHRRFPAQLVQQEFAPGTRLVEVMFNYLDFHQVDKELVHWEETVDESENEFALHVFTISGKRSGALRLNTTSHTLSHRAVRRLGAMYRAVLEDMARGPEGDATSVYLAPDDARWLRTNRDGAPLGARPDTVADAFAAWARVRPDAPAVRHGGDSLTYAGLAAAADGVADALRRVGVGSGDLVAVAPRPDLSLPACLLGIWQTGAGWLVLDDAVPADRRSAAAHEAGATALVVPAPVEPGVAAADRAAAVTVTGMAAVAPDGGPRARWRPGAVACVLPRVGTAPDGGALVSHRALAHAVASARAGLDAAGAATGEGSVWSFAGTFRTAADLTGLLLPLTSGGQVVIGSAPLPAVTHLPATPAAVERALSELPVGHRPAVLVGGDPLVSIGFPAGADDTRMVRAEGVDGVPGWLSVDGRPLPGLRLDVRDPHLRVVPVGVLGELCVSGPTLPDGYHADPAATAAAFVPDPDGRGGGRLLRTGQLARYREDGRLEHLGPIAPHTALTKNLVDLGRVRTALLAQAAVRDAYVLARHDAAAGRRVVGYVRPTPDVPFDPAVVRRSVAGLLPRRLLPDVLVSVEAWPLRPDGTVDPDRLPEPPTRDDATAATRTPWDEPFEALLRTVLPFLPAESGLSPDLELTAYGLNSLSTVELLISLEHTYGFTIPGGRLVLDMFETPATLWDAVRTLRTAQPLALATEQP
jgi:non-ribosomal peptide synthetase component F/acyl carrier protein